MPPGACYSVSLTQPPPSEDSALCQSRHMHGDISLNQNAAYGHIGMENMGVYLHENIAYEPVMNK